MLRKLREILPYRISRRMDIRKYTSQVRKFDSDLLDRLPAVLRSSIDVERIERLRKGIWDRYRADPGSAAKYADYEPWLWFNVERAGRLSLHKTPRLRILDIGCGPAYFLAAARSLGHDCYGVDVPESYFTQEERRVYSELLAALDVRKFVNPLLIERFQPLNLPERDLDLITAFWICFNRHRQPDEWGPDEWRFFVEDAVQFLRSGAWLHLELNANPERYGKLFWYDARTLDYFRTVGTVRNNQIRIQKTV